MESKPSPDWIESLKAESTESGVPLADSRQMSCELHLALAARVGRALLSLVDSPDLIAYDTTGTVVKRASETILSPSCKLDSQQLEALKPDERQLAVFKSRAWPLTQLEEPDRQAVQVQSRDLDWLAKEENPGLEQIATVLARGDDDALEQLVGRHHLEPGQLQLAFVRGGPKTRAELLQQDGFQLTASDRQLVLDEGRDENIALLLQRYHHCLTSRQWRQALAAGGDATLSEMARQGRLTNPADRLVALTAGGDDALSELVGQGNLSPDELTIAIWLGGYNTLSALVDQRQQLTKRHLAALRLLAKRRNLLWLLQRLDQDPGPDDPGPGAGRDPNPGGSPGGDPGPVGARPGPGPDSLDARLELDEPGLAGLPPELVRWTQSEESNPADDETVGV